MLHEGEVLRAAAVTALDELGAYDIVLSAANDKAWRVRRSVANLEDISLSGACLQVDRPVPLGTPYRITYPKGVLVGKVKYCVFREIGYFLGIEFEAGSRWSRNDFRPQHLLDPRHLVNRTADRLTADRLKDKVAPEPAA